MFPQTKNVQISGNTITKILGLSLSAVATLEQKQGLNTNFVLQLKTSQQNIPKINIQMHFFCFFAYYTILGNSKPSFVFSCNLCIHLHLCKIDLNSCNSYSARFVCNIIPIDLTATQGSTTSRTPVPQFKQLSFAIYGQYIAIP